MNRRSFLNGFIVGTGSRFLSPPGPRTEHLVFINLGGGVRKKDYYENAALSPNINRLARQAFVFEEDHCERVASHEEAFAELLRGDVLHSVGTMQVDSIDQVSDAMRRYRPRILVCREWA